MRIRFFRLPTYKQFEYKPRYFDPAKEELQERVRRIQREMGQTDAPYVPNIKGQFRAHYNRNSQKVETRSNLRLLIIFAALLGISYWFLGDVFRAILGF